MRSTTGFGAGAAGFATTLGATVLLSGAGLVAAALGAATGFATAADLAIGFATTALGAAGLATGLTTLIGAFTVFVAGFLLVLGKGFALVRDEDVFAAGFFTTFLATGRAAFAGADFFTGALVFALPPDLPLDADFFGVAFALFFGLAAGRFATIFFLAMVPYYAAMGGG
ncbi:MAG TPA: hypothetical protein PK760_01535 [Flavobacteriales bacterium]|nr:hypothetical protein [Flavobacteriales bacterium]